MFDYTYLIEKGINGDRFYAITCQFPNSDNKKTADIKDVALAIGKTFQQTTELLETFNGRRYSALGSKRMLVVYDNVEDIQNAIVTIKLMVQR